MDNLYHYKGRCAREGEYLHSDASSLFTFLYFYGQKRLPIPEMCEYSIKDHLLRIKTRKTPLFIRNKHPSLLISYDRCLLRRMNIFTETFYLQFFILSRISITSVNFPVLISLNPATLSPLHILLRITGFKFSLSYSMTFIFL